MGQDSGVVERHAPAADSAQPARQGLAWREVAVAVPLSIVAAVVMTWPAMRHPASTIPEDTADPLLQSWQVAWVGHAALTQPLHLFDTNAFYPLTNSLAFSDSLLGYLPAGLVGGGLTAAVVRYHLLYLFAYALAGFGAWALARQLGCRPWAAAVAGAAFAYAPWRIAHAGHLNILSSGGLPLALAMLARGHGVGRDGFDPGRVRPGWVVAGWATAAWQVTLGWGLGLPLVYVLGLVVVATLVWWVVAGRPPPPPGLLRADLLGAGLLAVVGAAMAVPYFRAVVAHPEAKRSAAWVTLFSPPPSGFLAAPEQSRVWGGLTAGARNGLGWAPEMTLFPGLLVVVLAVAGVVLPTWSLRRRLLLAGVVMLTGVLAMGTVVLGGHWTYLPLLHLPGWSGLRTPGRLWLWGTLALGLLAASAVDWVHRRVRGGAVMAGVAAALVALEGLATVPQPSPAPAPAALAVAPSPTMVLPSDEIGDLTVMYWTTRDFPRVANGSSGFTPRETEALRTAVESFPDASSVAALRLVGVRSVVLLPDRAAGTPWADAAARSLTGLGVSRRVVGDAIVYTIPP